jgi:hypothetical protein
VAGRDLPDGQDRQGRAEELARGARVLIPPEQTLAEMYVQGVSTRKVKAVAEELCGHAFSASAISAVNTSGSTRSCSSAEPHDPVRQPHGHR